MKKVSQKDYTISMFPKTRKEVFKDVIRLHFLDLLKIGFLSFVFILPLLFIIIFKDQYILNLNLKLQNLTNENEIEAIKKELYTFKNTTSLFIIICLLIYSLFFSGMIRVIRQYSWEENVYFKTDFKKGVKDNFKQVLFLFFLIGLIYAFEMYLYDSYNYSNNNLYNILFILTLCFSLIFILPIIANTFVCIPIYQNKLFDNFKIAMFIYVKNPLKTWRILLITTIILLSSLIPNVYFHFFGILIGYISIPYAILAYDLFSYNLLDKHLNIYKYVEIVNKGLNLEKENDKNEN